MLSPKFSLVFFFEVALLKLEMYNRRSNMSFKTFLCWCQEWRAGAASFPNSSEHIWQPWQLRRVLESTHTLSQWRLEMNAFPSSFSLLPANLQIVPFYRYSKLSLHAQFKHVQEYVWLLMIFLWKIVIRASITWWSIKENTCL